LVFFVAVVSFCWAPVASHARPLSMIRDAEIENIIRIYSTPVFEAAGLNAKAIKLYLVNDPSLNAFVAGGQNLFLNTGLLLQSGDPGEVIGVIAHETGHIAGGHLARQHEALAQTAAASILSLILGGAAVIAGAGEAGAAVMAGGQGIAQRNFLAYSRGHEASADQAAMTYLDRTGQSSKGLLTFMKKLENQELLFASNQDPYLLTHPLTKERIDAIGAFVERSPNSQKPWDPKLVEMHARMKAKLVGYMTPGAVNRTYKREDNSLPARYARAIAFYRSSNMEQFLPAIESLIADYPNDPFFHEVRGQGLWENGRAEEALVSYTKASELLQESDLLRRDLARVQVSIGRPDLIAKAVENLRVVVHNDRFSAGALQELGNAYYKQGDEPRARLYHADAAFLRGEMDKAIYNGEVASRAFREGSAEWLRAKDIVNAAQVHKKQKELRR